MGTVLGIKGSVAIEDLTDDCGVATELDGEFRTMLKIHIINVIEEYEGNDRFRIQWFDVRKVHVVGNKTFVKWSAAYKLTRIHHVNWWEDKGND